MIMNPGIILAIKSKNNWGIREEIIALACSVDVTTLLISVMQYYPNYRLIVYSSSRIIETWNLFVLFEPDYLIIHSYL
jgi:hypothetical protein